MICWYKTLLQVKQSFVRRLKPFVVLVVSNYGNRIPNAAQDARGHDAGFGWRTSNGCCLSCRRACCCFNSSIRSESGESGWFMR